jgi:murein DD-endopeptidase MepM/ murein hydrolase activator NlpD
MLTRCSLLLIATSLACTQAAPDRPPAVVADSTTPVPPPVAESLAMRPSTGALTDTTRLQPVTDSLASPRVEATGDSLILSVPVDGVSPWELRDTFGDPRTGHAHEALDIMSARGTRVLSATDGRLTKLFLSKQGGIMVYAADASDRYVLMYGHLDRYADGLAEGMPLRRGQLLGFVGSTGDAVAAGPHLHFAIARGQPSVAWWKGEAVNPYPLLFRAKP